jgi:hypothetical protein
MAKDFDEIIKEIKQNFDFHAAEAKKYIFHKEESERFKKLLDAAGVCDENRNVDQTAISKSKINGHVKKIKKTKTRGRLTFENAILKILEDGVPRLSRELQEEHERMTGEKYDTKNFASKLSIAARNKKLANVKYDDYPIAYRYWWGLTNWIEGDKFRKEFDKKVIDKSQKLST